MNKFMAKIVYKPEVTYYLLSPILVALIILESTNKLLFNVNKFDVESRDRCQPT